MTIKQALNARLTIEPGDRVATPVGWVRSDRVLMCGREIGCIRTRRARGRIEVVTVAPGGETAGLNAEWLVLRAGRGCRSAA
jgi:hypothetical protein